MINRNLYKPIIILLICTHVLVHLKSSAQEKKQETGISYFTAGFGVMEVLNIGLDFDKNNSQFGFKIGGFAADGESLFSFTTDYSFYFADNSNKTGLRSWFVKAGIQYFSDKVEYFSEKATGIITRFGKKFYFSDKAGIKCDLGLFFRIHHEEQRKRQPLLDFDMPIMPGMGISFFFKL